MLAQRRRCSHNRCHFPFSRGSLTFEFPCSLPGSPSLPLRRPSDLLPRHRQSAASRFRPDCHLSYPPRSRGAALTPHMLHVVPSLSGSLLRLSLKGPLALCTVLDKYPSQCSRGVSEMTRDPPPICCSTGYPLRVQGVSKFQESGLSYQIARWPADYMSPTQMVLCLMIECDPHLPARMG